VGMPVLRYKTDIPANSISNNLLFSNYIELKDKVKKLDSIDFMKEGIKYIKYIDNESLLEYKKFFYRFNKGN
ncbi:MAG: hypothetical protein KAU90_12000, partial [Sulfurovaceae bacterium]|nr:hypothetical protein [Sulfurovaceae bacterium]